MRAVIYDRVSEDRAQGRSVAEQERDNRQVVERNGWELVGVFTDNDKGASRYSRTARRDWKRLLELLEDRGADVLVTWEASRSTRDLEVYVQLRELCRRGGVLWCYNGRTFDLRRSDDAFSTGLDILLAEKEVDQTRERVLRAVRTNAVNGRPHGKILYGYQRRYDPATRQLLGTVLDEDRTAVVREVARRVLSGETPYSVAQDLNARSVPTPRNGKAWDLVQIKRLCTNPGYIAKRVHRGQVVGDADWPPILDDATHYALVARLNDPARLSRRDGAVQHLLSGIATCGVCGGRVGVGKGRGGYRTYFCVDGFHVSRKESDVDGLVEAVVIGRLSQPDLLDLLTAGESEDVQAAMSEVREKRARLDSFYDAAAAGQLSAAALARIEARLLPEIEAAQRRAARVTVAPVLGNAAGPQAEARWATLMMPQRREVVALLMTVEIMPAGRGARTFDPRTVTIAWRGQA
jgi:DNA invertase Pin-like site-specific DNA recombinase